MKHEIVMGDLVANKLIDSLIARGCDFTLLFWLRYPHVIVGSELGTDLQVFLEEHQLKFSHFQNRQFLKDFFTVVRVRFNDVGIQSINPKNFIVEKNKGGKQALLDRYSTVDWPRPRCCYCTQTMGGGDVMFMIHQTWQDALILQRDMLLLNSYMLNKKIVPVYQAYEHQWGENKPVRLMIDWEIMQSAYEDRLSHDEISKIPDRFPEWLVGRLRETRCIDGEVEVECVVKDKTRQKGGDWKFSRHFIFNICAVTMHGHYQALSEVIKPWVARIQQFHRDKLLSGIDDKDLSHPVWGWDNRLLRGQNGIGTLFGRKPNEPDAPLPTVPYRLLLRPGNTKVHRYEWSDKEHSIPVLGNQVSLTVLFKSSYSIALPTMITYDTEFIRRIKVITIYYF